MKKTSIRSKKTSTKDLSFDPSRVSLMIVVVAVLSLTLFAAIGRM